ncbi:MAG: hypothetical protein IT440_03965 [Phycisphaeraceae bacterium]|nr:hypothetical protein [Phycisphaeraceae bacterium]
MGSVESGAAAMMTSKERFLAVLSGGIPDRGPVTTHWITPYFLNAQMGGVSAEAFYETMGLDPILYATPHKPGAAAGDYADPRQKEAFFLESRRVVSDQWRIFKTDIPGREHPAARYDFVTPDGALSMLLESDAYSSWVVEPLIKKKRDIDLLGKYMTSPLCDVQTLNRQAEQYGRRGLVRSYICCFDVFGQPGTWQDATCLVGTEELIMETYDDPKWVHELLGILHRRKATYARSLRGAKYDILELGGGSASSTVISPKIFDDFVAPYDAELIRLAHEAGQRIAYHTCGGMMPLLERIAAMKPDAMETFTPPGMGGDVDLAEARRRVPRHITMIGGFDQGRYFERCTESQTRAEVRRCVDAAGREGGYILCPSDQFFDADPRLVRAFADEAHACTYVNGKLACSRPETAAGSAS